MSHQLCTTNQHPCPIADGLSAVSKCLSFVHTLVGWLALCVLNHAGVSQPCMWGNPAHGLEAPVLLSGVTIHVASITNNTYGHHGEMALPQLSLAKGPFNWA